jgi:pantothenate kinase type III
MAAWSDGPAGRGTGQRAYHREVIIAVDIGNSAAKAALVEGSTVREVGRLDTSLASTADLADGLRILAGSAPETPARIVAVASSSLTSGWGGR